MMCIDTALGVVRVFAVGAPTCLVLKHIKSEEVYALVLTNQVYCEKGEVQQTVWHKVVFQTFKEG
jgi:hypothetical protein